jgi:CRISPR-associated endonuclease Cas1
MRNEANTFFPPLAIRHGVLVFDGYGLRVTVERGHLVVSDGIGDRRRRGRFPKATCGLRRLALLGHSGYITLEALRWVHDVGAAVVQVDADGRVILASGPPGTSDSRLLRAQAAASQNGTGIRIVRDLVREKLRGQATLLDRFPNAMQAAEEIRDLEETSLDRATTMDQLRALESQAAASYWKSWEEIPVRFPRRDEPQIPDAWKRFGLRHSPLTGSPRNAISPASAVLNYLYSVLETETRLAIRVIGLAPEVAFLHADQRFRDSLIYDLMEPVRPEVDSFLLDLLKSRVFAKSEFVETRQGVCRVLPPLTHMLMETAPRWGQAVAPVVERVMELLMKDVNRGRRVQTLPITPLTQSNRSAGRDRIRRGPRKVRTLAPTIPQACRNCGVLLDRTDRMFCEECLPKQYGESGRKALATGRRVLSRLRDQGEDPAHGGQAAQKRGKRIARQFQARAAWNSAHETGANVQAFRKEILPRLRDIPLTTMARVTGFSRGYCSFIRRGVRIPHPRVWGVLRSLAGNPSRLEVAGVE